MIKSICIIGPPATGKTTLAFKIADGDRSKILQMDDIAYQFYLQHKRKPNSDEWYRYFLGCVDNKYLITEGFYRESVDYRLKTSDVIIIYHAGTLKCVFRAIKRGFFNLFTETSVHEESRENFFERFRYFFSPRIYLRILFFNKKNKKYIEDRIRQPNIACKKIFHIKSLTDAEDIAKIVKNMLAQNYESNQTQKRGTFT